jgi:hypothetical protein
LLDPAVLAELIRHLQAFESLHEAEGIDCLGGPDGEDYCLADLVRLYAMRRVLPPRQAAAIECIYQDMHPDVASLVARIGGPREVAAQALEGFASLCVMFEESLWGGKGNGRDGSRQYAEAAPA